jgi:hypothetical protein
MTRAKRDGRPGVGAPHSTDEAGTAARATLRRGVFPIGGSEWGHWGLRRPRGPPFSPTASQAGPLAAERQIITKPAARNGETLQELGRPLVLTPCTGRPGCATIPATEFGVKREPWCAFVSFGVALAVHDAWGAGLVLQWSAPPECPDVTDVRESVEKALGRELGEADSAALTAHGAVLAASGRWELTLVIGSGTSGARSRRLEGNSCREVADAAALVLALALEKGEPDSRQGGPASIGKAAGQTQNQAASVRGQNPTAFRHLTGERSAATAPLQWAIGAFGAVDPLSLPQIAPGAGLRVWLKQESMRLEIASAYFPPRRAEPTGGPEAGDFDLLVAAVQGCWLIGVPIIDTALCGGAEVGTLSGKGVGVVAPTREYAPWLAPMIGVHAAWEFMEHQAITWGGDVLLPVGRDRFVIVGLGSAHRAPPLTARGMVGWELRFP